MDQNYLIVVSILEGRYFPSRSNCSLIVEAKFDGETMTTDPVPHSCNPNFNTELAWCVDRRSLHLHRMGRTPVKLQCTAVDNSGKTEVCGYLVLEIRSIQKGKKLAKWLPLLNTKYHGSKPELQIGMHLESDSVENPPVNVNKDRVLGQVVNAERTKVQQGSQSSEDTAEELIPRLNVENSCIEIGPASAITQLYMYGVTVSFAANLNQLVAKNDKTKLQPPYHFLYHLLGHEVTTENFDSLSNPKFPAERASVRIYSSPDILQKYFRANSSLQILLCCVDSIFGEAVIPLDQFSSGSAVPKYPALIEGIFQLHPVPPNKELSSHVKPEYRPVVGVQVEIYFPDERSPRRANSLDRGRHTPRWRKEEQQRLEYSPPQRLAKQKDTVPSNAQEEQRVQDSTVTDAVPETSVLVTEVERDEQIHHYCFTLDLRSIYLYPPCPEIQSYVRYHYPFFGTSSPFESEMWTDLRRNAQVTIKGGYCTFNFASTLAMVEDAFKELPLCVEVVCQDRGKECLFGTADIHLEAIFSCPTTSFVSEGGKVGYRKILTSKVPISISGGTIAGELQAVISLDDLGVTTLPAGASIGDVGKMPSKQTTPTKKNSKIATEEEVTAMLTELEVWKQQQEILFRKQLKEKEDAHLKALTEEWKQHDMEREHIMKRKLKEYQNLDERLKAALEDVEKREQSLMKQEAEIAKQKSEFQFLKTRVQRETKEAISRSLNEYEHLLELERKKSSSLEKENAKLMAQVCGLDRQIKEKEKALEAMKNSQRTSLSNDMKMKTDYDKLFTEKIQLSKELHGAYEQQQHYKEKWCSVTQELQECKKKLEGFQRETLRTQMDEVEALYQRSRARFGQRLTSEGGDAAQDKIPPQVQTTKSGSTTTEQRSSPSDLGVDDRTAKWTGGAWNQHIRRLIGERDTLLKTGVYKSGDRIILELNRHITEALARENK
ncbi:centrosomal protein of 120 kDa-like isoform X2 [Ornithodoros turicata]|uniref:centrosomal protein of 120 kDa-like isoform X2 n=1 Tax=Ornithodoros turicata TaxID=34597 RepID=UPI0031387ABE